MMKLTRIRSADESCLWANLKEALYSCRFECVAFHRDFPPLSIARGNAVDEVITVDPSETEVPAGLLRDWSLPGVVRLDGEVRIVEIQEVKKRDECTY
ncbi:hypothetical protein JWG42_15835 [Desulfoprunum benzoelyticum]|uniref:Uncharacterized protein n=1 Tax=Desulfoprunum benzoelyticum TaxID=1506996 RepID=A0A840UQT9_9BACT|nr:hypothetical protein [Desulfoprunum benzoelyticum]MBB5347003.1 hypothetical protein [Desulfoprunum benzoelyticum]MBM9531629.1 hypothetical protein [Desulfoprunum benzoelyticum]